MIRVDGKEDQELGGPLSNPWPALIAGWVLIGLAAASYALVRDQMAWLSVALTGAGVLAAGIAVAIRPKSFLNLLLAGASAFVASWVGDELAWDSARLALRVLGAVAIFSAFVVLFPVTYRRVVISVLIVFHFVGISCAVSSADQAWVAVQMWNYIYRPYLLFMYLNNAYHFYSPEPGPAPLIWFRIEYQPDRDGTQNVRWVKVPYVDADGNYLRPDGSALWPKVQYTRRLSLAESINRPMQMSPVNAMELSAFRDQEIAKAREAKSWPLRAMPLIRELPFELQSLYQEPDEGAKKWISRYARYVARTYKHDPNPDLEVKGVKVYKVIHRLIPAGFLALGLPPDDPELYMPYFLGEFDKDGNMKEATTRVKLTRPDNSTIEVARDPMLYWIIPRVRAPGDSDAFPNNMAAATKNMQRALKRPIHDYLAVYAGDVPEGKTP